MTELVDRYVHQVGRQLPVTLRADIEAELRSQIHDQLDDRFGGAPSQDDVVKVLAELGDPRRLAAEYRDDQYLIGPALYPTLIAVLRYGWAILPPIVLFLNVFGALTAPESAPLVPQLVGALLSALQVGIVFTGVVVLIFAGLERTGIDIDVASKPFDPLALPPVDDPSAVDRVEAASGIAVGTVFSLVLVYFLSVGGLTLRFNLSDPGEVIPFPSLWGVLMLATAVAMIALHVIVLRRQRWGYRIWALQTALEVFGSICLYFILFKPLFGRIAASVPAFAMTPVLSALPEIIVVAGAVVTLLGRGSQLAKLWNRPANP